MAGDPRDRSNPGLAETLRLLKLPRHKPTDADRPPPSPAPGRKIEPLPGQLDLLEGDEAA
jgi:hypothetical protein